MNSGPWEISTERRELSDEEIDMKRKTLEVEADLHEGEELFGVVVGTDEGARVIWDATLPQHAARQTASDGRVLEDVRRRRAANRREALSHDRTERMVAPIGQPARRRRRGRGRRSPSACRRWWSWPPSPSPNSSRRSKAPPIKSLTVEELQWVQRIAAWYATKCMEAGAPSPPDILRALASCANEVVSYNLALAKAEEQAGRATDDAQTRQ